MLNELALPYRRPPGRQSKRRPKLKKVYDQESKRRESRATIEQVRANDSGLSRCAISRLVPSQMQWLHKYDGEWLEGILPKSRNWGPRVDWHARDATLAGMVNEAKRRLIEEGAISGTRRVSISGLMWALGADPRAVRQGRLPRMLLALKKAPNHQMNIACAGSFGS
jgi:hypothetical protein